MPWECLGCGLRNKDGLPACDECFLDKETATTMPVKRKKLMCRDCGHRHREGEYCHVYCEVDPDDDEGDGEEGEDDEDDDDDDDDPFGYARMGLKGKPPPKKAEEPENKPLTTPSWAKAIGYGRCNCDTGVPVQSRRYEGIPKVVTVGGIRVMMQEEIKQGVRKKEEVSGVGFVSKAAERRAKAEAKRAANYRFAEMLPHIVQFLPVSQICIPAVVASHFNYGTCLYKYYTDMRDMTPWAVYRLHQGPVEGLAAVKDHCVSELLIVSSGDRRIMISNGMTGEVMYPMARDSGTVPCLLYHDHDLFAASSNGSIRNFTLPHNLSRITLNRTMWEHSRSIRRMMLALPSVGHCTLHGLEGHICHLYTASEDRTICIWNIATCMPVRSVTSKALRQSVITCIAQSPRHIFAGTSDAAVVVFTKEDVCERKDIHACNTPGAVKQGCLQITLRLSETGSARLQSGEMPAINAILCTGLHRTFTDIWAADSVGQISVWKNPVKEGLDFRAKMYWRAHNSAINDMQATRTHVLTIGDDGYVIVHDMRRYCSVRCMHAVTWALDKGLLAKPEIPRRIKCMNVTESDDPEGGGGTLLLGTSYGEVMVCSIGTTL